MALQYASEDMKIKEGVVMAAVQQNGMLLICASEDMKNQESVVMAAVQQNGEALEYASDDMQNNESIVMAAVQQNGYALEYASEDMMNMISNGALKFGIDVQQYAQAMLNHMLIEVQVSKESGTQDLTL